MDNIEYGQFVDWIHGVNEGRIQPTAKQQQVLDEYRYWMNDYTEQGYSYMLHYRNLLRRLIQEQR